MESRRFFFGINIISYNQDNEIPRVPQAHSPIRCALTPSFSPNELVTRPKHRDVNVSGEIVPVGSAADVFEFNSELPVGIDVGAAGG